MGFSLLWGAVLCVGLSVSRWWGLRDSVFVVRVGWKVRRVLGSAACGGSCGLEMVGVGPLG